MHMLPEYRVVVGTLGVVHTSVDPLAASQKFYERIVRPETPKPPVLLFEDGVLIAIFEGTDYKNA